MGACEVSPGGAGAAYVLGPPKLSAAETQLEEAKGTTNQRNRREAGAEDQPPASQNRRNRGSPQAAARAAPLPNTLNRALQWLSMTTTRTLRQR